MIKRESKRIRNLPNRFKPSDNLIKKDIKKNNTKKIDNKKKNETKIAGKTNKNYVTIHENFFFSLLEYKKAYQKHFGPLKSSEKMNIDKKSIDASLQDNTSNQNKPIDMSIDELSEYFNTL